MKPMKSALALFAATGLVLSQPALAAGIDRSGSPSAEAEHLAGTPGAAWPAIIAILAVVVISVISASGHDNHHPKSP